MKKNFSTFVMGQFFFRIIKDDTDALCRKKILEEYERILDNAKDIGRHNTLLSAYALGAWFIAMNREDGLSPDENIEILTRRLKASRVFSMVMGDADHYLSEKRIEKQKKWAENTQKRIYENDWVVELLPKNNEYDLGYDYLECGVCKLFNDEGCPNLAKYICRLDYMFAETMGLRLERTLTLAEGADKCDFRFFRLK